MVAKEDFIELRKKTVSKLNEIMYNNIPNFDKKKYKLTLDGV